jgi:thiamine biosynthesis protein ThiS
MAGTTRAGGRDRPGKRRGEMKIQLNGDPYELAEPASIADLLTRLVIDPRRVAVERNFVVIKRDLYGATAIGEGDEIEIVNFVGGG